TTSSAVLFLLIREL
ncbi:hypothetical protein CP99DC5_1021B, partial [Chlamydia psittaci 99DC5]